MDNFDILGLNEQLPVLVPFSRGTNDKIRGKKIGRKFISSTIPLRSLVAGADLKLKMSIADDLSTPMEVLFILAEDESLDLRYALAENHNLSRDLLEFLTLDSNPYVAHRARKTIIRMELNDSEFTSWIPCLSA
ncbi:MAG: hypothetical protein K2X27_09360 [Candidatus Obscuribacterales bacterium]|nr:hypothetical protein [Candidatus Obscuribacterales bacterium]